MKASIPQIVPMNKLCQLVTFSVLEEIYPREHIATVLSQDHAWERRERKLNHLIMIYLLIAWSLMARSALRSVYDRLLQPLRLMGNGVQESTPSSGALCYRRECLGVRVFRHLFRLACRPFAHPDTPGCFAFGLRLMGIDGTTFSVADTPENRACFAKHEHGSATAPPFPKLLATLLVEVGTHAIVDAIPAVSSVGEARLVKGLLRSITSGMLVLMDRGFYSAGLFATLARLGAHGVCRLASNRLLAKKAERVLPDGSFLIRVTSKDDAQIQHPLTLRVITYHLLPQAAQQLEQVTPSHSQHASGTTNPKVHEVHRLVTTLLDPVQVPALDLIMLYHERWEVELVIDEIKDHQRVAQHPLESKHPMGIFQEFYALLLGHYALRHLMGKAALQAGHDPDRISFTHTIELVTDTFFIAPVLSAVARASLSDNLTRQLARLDWLVPARRLRFNSRVIKRSRTRFQTKRPHHVFLSAKHFPFLQGLIRPSFRELLLI